MEKGRGKGTDTLQTDKVFTRKEYIKREAAIDALQNHYEVRNAVQNGIMDECVMLMMRVPAADVVARDCYDRLLAENDELRKERPVVRCKDCICFHPIGTSKHNGDCDKHYERVQGDDYCSWAEVEQDD